MSLETQARCGAAEYGNVARANFAQIETQLAALESDVGIVATANLAADVAAIGGDNKELIIASTTTVSAGLTIPTNIKLNVKPGGSIVVNAPLVINGAFEAELHPVFTGTSTVTFGPAIAVVYPQWFGLKGDGVTDDTVAIQTAVAVACRSGKTCVFDGITTVLKGHVFLYDRGSIVGKNRSKIILDGITEVITGDLDTYFAIGVKTYGEAGAGDIWDYGAEENTSIWKGTISGIHFHATANNNVVRVLQGMQMKSCLIENVRLTTTYLNANKIPITFFYCVPRLGRWWTYPAALYGFNDVHIRGCHVDLLDCAMSADVPAYHNEGIDFASSAAVNNRDIYIENNTLIGSHDDLVALHGTKCFSIKNNILHQLNGRLIFTSVRDGVVSGNIITKLPAYPDGTAPEINCVFCDVESTPAGKPGRVIVTDNIVKITASTTSRSGTTHGLAMNFIGAFDLDVDNNIIVMDDPTITATAIGLQSKPVPGFVWDPGTSSDDPEYPFTAYPDAANIPKCYNIRLRGNKSLGLYPGDLWINYYPAGAAYDSKTKLEKNEFPVYTYNVTPATWGITGDTAITIVTYGSGSPEGTLIAPAGSMYINTDGGANTTFYVKESGTGNTGWVAK